MKKLVLGLMLTACSVKSSFIPEYTKEVALAQAQVLGFPTIISASPATILRGTTTTITINGTGFTAGGVVNIIGGGLAVSKTTVLSSMQASVVVTSSSTTAYGARSIKFTPAVAPASSYPLNGALTVVPLAQGSDPAITSISPMTINPGTVATITATGTGFVPGGSLVFIGGGLAVGATNVVSATQATVQVTASAATVLGPRTVKFTPPASAGLLNALYVVPPSPTISVVTPSSTEQGVIVTMSVSGTGFLSGGNLAVPGAGITVGPTTITGNQATAQLTVSSNATIGTYDVIYTQSPSVGGATITAAGAISVIYSANPPILVRGTGAATNPASITVIGHNMLPVNVNNHNSAMLIYGTTEVSLNLWDNSVSGLVPTQVEFSLDGGPWYATRSDRITLPIDLPDGEYQIRVVSWPATGMSMVWTPIVVTKSTYPDGASVWSPK